MLRSIGAFAGALLMCVVAQSARSVHASDAAARKNTTPAFTITYKSGTANTMTIKGSNFALFSLLNLTPGSSQGFSVAGNTLLSVFTSNANSAVVPLADNILTSNGNYYYTVVVSKKGLGKATCKAASKQFPALSFTCTDDNPPTKSTFSLTFVVQNVSALPTTATKSPQPTLQGLPNLTFQIGSAYFTTTKIKKNKASYP